MGKMKDLQIQQMNIDRVGKILITMTKDSRFTAHYKEMIESRGRVFKALPLIATRKAYIDPGCSASLYHEIAQIMPEVESEIAPPIMVYPDKEHLIADGLLIEVAPVQWCSPIFTSVFNMSNEQKKIKEGEVYSILHWMSDSLVEWEIV